MQCQHLYKFQAAPEGEAGHSLSLEPRSYRKIWATLIHYYKRSGSGQGVFRFLASYSINWNNHTQICKVAKKFRSKQNHRENQKECVVPSENGPWVKALNGPVTIWSLLGLSSRVPWQIWTKGCHSRNPNTQQSSHKRFIRQGSKRLSQSGDVRERQSRRERTREQSVMGGDLLKGWLQWWLSF